MFIISFSDEFITSFGTIVVIPVLSILLIIAVASIIIQRFRKPNIPKDTKKENKPNQEQHVYENGQQHFIDFTVVDENQQYIELDTKKNASLYHNLS